MRETKKAVAEPAPTLSVNPVGGIASSVVGLFKDLWDSASNEDKRTIYDITRRHAEKRGWK